MKTNKTRRQKPILGGRDALPSCVIHEIKRKVENIALRNNVSKSFVIAVILADGLNIKDQERF